MVNGYQLPTCLKCQGELYLESFYDKIVPHINNDGTVEFERQSKDGPILTCTKCEENYEYGFDSRGRIELETEEF
jgi:hypothetical protein